MERIPTTIIATRVDQPGEPTQVSVTGLPADATGRLFIGYGENTLCVLDLPDIDCEIAYDDLNGLDALYVSYSVLEGIIGPVKSVTATADPTPFRPPGTPAGLRNAACPATGHLHRAGQLSR